MLTKFEGTLNSVRAAYDIGARHGLKEGDSITVVINPDEKNVWLLGKNQEGTVLDYKGLLNATPAGRGSPATIMLADNYFIEIGNPHNFLEARDMYDIINRMDSQPTIGQTQPEPLQCYFITPAQYQAEYDAYRQGIANNFETLKAGRDAGIVVEAVNVPSAVEWLQHVYPGESFDLHEFYSNELLHTEPALDAVIDNAGNSVTSYAENPVTSHEGWSDHTQEEVL